MRFAKDRTVRTVLVLAAITLLASNHTVVAQGTIGLFADNSGTSCNIIDAGPGNFSVFVVLTNHTGTFGCDFRIESEMGVTASVTGESSPFTVLGGTAETGVTIVTAPIGCIAAPAHVYTVDYFGFGDSQTCSKINVVANINSNPPGTNIINCSGIKSAASTESITFNPDGQCNCAVPTEETSWGRIKVLFED